MSLVRRLDGRASVGDGQLRHADSSSMRVTFREKFALLDGDTYVDVARWNPMGNLIATAEHLGLPQIKIWDSTNGELLQVFGPERHYRLTSFLEWSPNGQLLASSYDISIDLIQVWDISMVEDPLVMEIHHDGRITSYSTIYSIAWNPTGSQLMSTGGSDTGEIEEGSRTIAIWDANSGEHLATLNDHADGVIQASWSPDGQYIAASTWFDDIRIWDATDMSLVSITTAYEDESKVPIPIIEWSPDGTQIASASCSYIPGDCSLWILDMSSGTVSEAFSEAHVGYVNDLDWHPDGRLLASAGEVDKAVRIWDAETHEELAIIDTFEDSVTSVDWSPDGSMLVASSRDGSARVWEIEVDDD